MASLRTRLACLGLLLALSGAPAALAACMAACQPGMSHHAMAAADPAVPQAADAHAHDCCPDPHAFTATPVAVVRHDTVTGPVVAVGPAHLLAHAYAAAIPLASPARFVPPAPQRGRVPLVLRV